jgi:hypothetical protein
MKNGDLSESVVILLNFNMKDGFCCSYVLFVLPLEFFDFLVLSSPYRSGRSPFVFVLGGSGTPGVWFCSRCDFLVRLSVRAALVSKTAQLVL